VAAGAALGAALGELACVYPGGGGVWLTRSGGGVVGLVVLTGIEVVTSVPCWAGSEYQRAPPTAPARLRRFCSDAVASAVDIEALAVVDATTSANCRG
jgi:hypothetical protein